MKIDVPLIHCDYHGISFVCIQDHIIVCTPFIYSDRYITWFVIQDFSRVTNCSNSLVIRVHVQIKLIWFLGNLIHI